MNSSTEAATRVLIIEAEADVYARRLRELFARLDIHGAPSMAEADIDPSEIDVLITFGHHINDDIVRRATRLKWIQSLATGVDHFLACPSLRSEVVLTSGRGIHGPAMRETVAFLLLSLTRDAARIVRDQAAHRWDRRPWALLRGKTALIVGVGIIGTATARLLQAFGMKVVGATRAPRDVEGFDAMVSTDRLVEAVREADFLINVLPATPQNTGLIGRRILEAMKPTAYYVNVGRGETTDEAALIDVLKAGKIAGAGLDVFRNEPLPPDSPLWDLPNVFLCPHLGGFITEYSDYVMPILVDNMRRFLEGRIKDMRNVIEH